MAKDTGVEAVREGAHALTGAPQEYDPLMRLIGDARVVLLGEASHGTHEFYQERARITARLIEEKGFTAVAVEADWPDALRVDRYVRGRSEDEFATEALADFKRFPTWMWRNTDVAEFLDWMRERNDALPEGASKAGFYGLDLYSLRASMESVLRYLEQVDPAAARQARERYACFDHFGEDTQVYGFATSMGLSKSCEEEVVHQLVELQRHAIERARRGGREEEEAFYAEQNARVVMNAEAYYRSMFVQEVSSWNLRDRHMAETIEQLVAYLERRGERAKIVVWAHNSHVGDARAAERAQRGELNVGQLVRERYGRDAVLIGFTTHHGTVTAASDWDAPAERKRVRPALPGSYETLFHETQVPRFLLALRERQDDATESLREAELERAIGVIYRPETERASHYFYARLPEQFDAILHFDETRAVEPLERTAEWVAGEVPETYPFAV
jgi:erythromycin esterase-like protein